MPDREKPKLLRAQIQNADGSTEVKTIREDQIVRRPRQRDSLTPEQQQKADGLYGRIGHAVGDRDQWINAFLHDSDPDSELEVWEAIADTVDELWNHPMAKKLLKRQVEQTVTGVSMGAVDLPAQIPGITDEFVELARKTYAANLEGS